MNRNLLRSIVSRRIEKVFLIGMLMMVAVAFVPNGCAAEPPVSQPPEAPAPTQKSAQPALVVEPPASPPPQAETPAPEPAPEAPPVIESTPGHLTFTATPEVEELEDVNWISPGKVNIDNLYPGATAEYPITIHNGGEDMAEFAITTRLPDRVTEGFEPLPEEYLSWVTIEQPYLVLEPKQTADVLIVIDMPEDAGYAAKRAEFWISVIDQSQAGMVRTELAARWLISTK